MKNTKFKMILNKEIVKSILKEISYIHFFFVIVAISTLIFIYNEILLGLIIFILFTILELYLDYKIVTACYKK